MAGGLIVLRSYQNAVLSNAGTERNAETFDAGPAMSE
jgi:hypothetical protein